MDFELSEEQKSLVALARDFCKREVSPEFWRECEKKEVTLNNPTARMPWDLIKKCHDVGLRTITVPKKYGGGGVTDFITLVALAEALGQWGGLLHPLLEGYWIYFADLAAIWNTEQQDEFFPQIMKDHKITIGTTQTEPNHGTDAQFGCKAAGYDTFAYRDGDEYVINGEKCFSSGGACDWLILHCRTDKNKPFRESTSLFLVPSKTPGVELIKINELLSGSTIRINGNVRYDNVRIPARYLLGEENKGYALWEGRRARWLENLAALIGAAQAVYELTKEYAKTRIQGGKPIFEHLNVGSRIVDMRLQIDAARALVYKTAWEYEQQKSVLHNPLGYNLCHAFTFEMLHQVAGHAEEIFGGYAALKEMPIEGFIRMAHGFAHGFGTPAMNLIASMDLI